MRTLIGAGLIVLILATATHAETGWYLLWPPSTADGWPILTAPLRQWQQDGGWGPWTSIAECQEGRRSLNDYAIAIRDHGAVGQSDEEAKLWGWRLWMQVRESLCIASNDPRLGK